MSAHGAGELGRRTVTNRENALVAAALKFVAKVESGRAFSRETYADLKGALALNSDESSCGSCAHANPEDYDDPTLIGCTHGDSFYSGQVMQATARCEKWEAK